MNAEYRVCERCHGAGGKWEMNLEQHLHSNVWVRCPGCGGSRWVVVRPAEALTPEQQAGIEKMLSTLDTPNTQGDPAAPTPDYYEDYEAEQWAERQAEADAQRDKSPQGSVVAIVPNPNRKQGGPMSKVLARGGGVLAMAALVGLAGFLWVQLDRAETARAEVEADLRQTADALDQQASANGALQLSLDESRANGDAQAAVSSGLRSDIGELLLAKDRLTAANGELELSLADAQAERAEIQQNLDDAAEQAAEEAGEQQQRYVLLFAENKDLRAEYATLQGTAGTVGALERRQATLRDYIADLVERRKPLILTTANAPTTGFKCTGSMEPTITCLDEAVWLENFQPEDLVVGAVIAFDAPPDCTAFGGGSTAISHRVMDIRVRANGVYEFWPKGDGNDEPDGCWVPHTNVTGYIIEFRRNAVPRNASLRNQVNDANDLYVTAELAYLDLIERYCGHRDPARCSLRPGPYAQATAAYRWHLETFRHWECWLRVALRSARPGDPFPYCLPPQPIVGVTPVQFGS